MKLASMSSCRNMSDIVKLLFIGDIVAKPGREITRRVLPELARTHDIDLVIANVENAAGGNGITRDVGENLRDCGIQVMTTGNHVWDKKEALSYILDEPRLLRPANYPKGVPGQGHFLARTTQGIPIGVVNVMGRIFMNPLDNPFNVVENDIATLRSTEEKCIILVDMHAEATSEKKAMGWHLDGKVTAVVGTHTHVQTADETILPNGTAYITDVGMTGPHDSIIGVNVKPALRRFIDGLPARFDTATGNPRLNAVVISADINTCHATSIERIDLSEEDVEP
jgi:metallophosphoesterase (TIGR00282 family)